MQGFKSYKKISGKKMGENLEAKLYPERKLCRLNRFLYFGGSFKGILGK